MLKIKLSPFGKKGERHYRIFVCEEHSKITGTATDVIGHYHPLSKQLVVDKKRLDYWLSKGAKPTPTIAKLIQKAK